MYGKRVFPIISDDCHSQKSFRGCAMWVGAKELTYEAMIEALENGDFYATNGPQIHSLYIDDREKYKDARGLQKSVPNAFDVSCLPWVNYRHFDVHVFDEGKFIAPVVTWGKYEQKDGRFIMPLSVNIHHAVCDGFHLSRFFNEVQQLIDSL